MIKKKNTRTQKEPKEEVINVRLTASQKATLEAVAARVGLGVSTWILQAALLAAEVRQEARR